MKDVMKDAGGAWDEERDGGAGEGIAIVGMAGRFPGAADLRHLWSHLREGIEGITFFSDEELAAAGIPAADLADPRYVKAAPILTDVDLFDAGFFRMSRPEAEVTDPQHRLFLECVWEALEDAGAVPARVRGTVGIYAGSSLSGYLFFNLRHTYTLSEQGFQSLIGNDKDYLASHAAYKLDLGGPAVGVQTACSTSLVAVHLACQSLLSHECDVAIAGGSTVRIPQKGGYVHQEGGVFSPDGHCRPFDRQAGGTIFGSGVGAVVLKRLDDALASGDRIYAVILGSAVNNDGARKVGFTAPGEDGQVRVVSEALEVAGVAPGEIAFIETHGTGTRLGDPIEVAALERVFRGVPPGDRCALGAIKSSLGHLESAAGIAGLIKTALALHHGEIPPTLHFTAPNPLIDFAGGPFYVSTVPRPWPDLGGPRRAGVSSFGIGGTNAHAVLEEAPQRRPSGGPAAPGEPQLLAISARAPEALRTLVERYRDRLRTEADAPARWQVAAGAALRRAHHDHRLAVVIDPGAADPAAPLDACLAGGGVRPPAGRRPKVVFVFPGQGSQWVGMGRRLLAGEPVFRRALEACDGAIRRSASWSLLEVLAADESASRLGELDVVQPTLFALQVALAALWRSWGVEPDALIGHSMGEVAAACVAGALSLDDAARVICRRSRLALQVRGRGAMAVVELSAADAAAALAGVTEVAVAARNSPRSTVLSGDARALDAVLERLEAQGVFCRRVKVDFASHCSQVDPLLPELQALLADIRPRAGEVPIYSTVEGRLTDGAGLDAGYWVRNLRQPVLLADMVEQARRDGHDFFLEVSPHPILVPSVADCLAGGDAPAVASLRRDESERGALLATLAAFYERGGNVSWEALFPGGGGFVELPTYPWQRERYWIDPVAPAAAPALARDGAAHPVLGEPLCSSLHPGTTFWPCRPAGVPPGDRLQGEATLPAALFLDLAWAAGSGARLEDVAFDAGGAWNEGETLQLALAPAGSDGAIFRISSAAKPAAGTWAVLAAGRATSLDPGPPARIDLAAIRARCGEPVTAEAFDRERREAGFVPAGGAKILGEILRRDGELLARLEPPPDAGFRVHPALLDACFQALAAAAPRTEGGPIPALPSGVDAVELHARPEGELWLHAALSSLPVGVPSAARLAGDVTVSDGAGRPVLALRGLRARWPVEHWLYEVRWEKAEAAPSAGAAGPWLLAGGGDRDGVAEALGQALAAGGETVVREPAGELRPREVVYLEGLAAQLGPEASGEEMSQAATEACAGLVRLVQTLEGWGDPLPRLTVVTRGAQPTGAATSAAPVQAPLWGLAAVIGNEHPELRCRIVDLDPAVPGEQELAALVRELRGGDREDKVALRGEERRVARLVRRPPPVLPAPRPAPVRAAATYLVTGGLGGLGLACARLLVDLGARHLVLLARRDATPAAAEALRGLAAAGAEVRTIAADVADASAVAAVLAEMAAGMPPLGGILHAAGVREEGPVEDSLLRRQTPERIRRVLAPKVAGAWNLHRLTRGCDLDFFVLFSSVSTLLGSLGQSSYAAANAFLDALAGHRRSSGLPCLTINWGAWAEVGMAAAAPELEKRLAWEGMASLASADALAVLERLLTQGREGAERVVVMPFRHALWRRFDARASAAPLFAAQAAAAGGEGEAAPGRELRERIDAAPPAERQEILEGYLAERVAEALRVPADRIAVDVPFNQLGLSSLLSLEARNRMERDLGLAIPIVQFLQSESLRQFAAQLAERLAVEQLLASVATDAPSAATDEWEQVTL